MGNATIRGGFDTFAYSGRPARNYAGRVGLLVNATTHQSFVYLKTPVPRRSTVVSAKLRLKVKGASTGSRTLTARRVAAPWKASKLTWDNKPGVSGSAKTAVIGTVADGDVVEFDVTTHLQSVANGSAHYGWRITTDATTTHKFYSFNADHNKPTLVVEWADKPGTPTDLIPASGVVSLDKPTLQFSYSDLSGDELDAVRVQIDPTANETSPAWTTETANPGGVPATEPELDLSTTTYPGLADGATTSWRVQVKDVTGLWSNWSDWATFTRRTKAALTIDNPPAPPNNYVTEPTPPIIWTFAGTQTAYRVRVTNADRSWVLWDSGRRRGADNSIDVPFRYPWNISSDAQAGGGGRVLWDDGQYSVNVRVWDQYDREATPDDPQFQAAWRDFTMDDDLTVAAPTLTATQDGITPYVVLTFQRATAPDEWVIRRDGKVIVANLDAGDASIGGTSYQYRDPSAEPHVAHTYTVQAVVNRKQGARSNVVTVTPDPEGIWLLDLAGSNAAVIFGQDSGTWTMADQAATYTPLGQSRTIRVVTGMRGLEGAITGVLVDGWGYPAKTTEATLLGFKETPAKVFQLVAGDVSIPVLVGDLTIYPTPSTNGVDVVKGVSFNFWQTGDLGFRPVM